MMKTVITLLLLVLLFESGFAQYRTYKDQYQSRNYSYEQNDRFSPALAGGLALLPGVGHFYTGTVGRGFAFIGGMTISFVAFPMGFALAWGGSEFWGPVLMLGGIAGFFGTYIWNIVDAVKVAKIKNMHFRGHDLTLNIIPYSQKNYSGSGIYSSGLTLAICF